MSHFAVVGGGLAGLAAAFDLVEHGATVTLLESSGRLGGQVHTRRESGFVVEDGAEGWVASDSDVPALLGALGIAAEQEQQVERRSLVLRNGQLGEMRSGDAARALGIQASDSDLGRGITSLRAGMATLTDALADRVRGRAAIELHAAVTAVSTDGRRTTLVAGDTSFDADAAILAVPAHVAASMLEPVAGGAAAILRRIPFSSNVSVSLGYPRGSVRHELDASGLVIGDPDATEGLRACAFSSSKLPHRAPDGMVLLRAFFRPAEGQGGDDAEWGARAIRLLSPILGISGEPVGSWVARWDDALPQYSASHRAEIDRTASLLRESGRFELAGTSFHPSGVPGAVRSGRLAARRLLGSH